MSIPLREQSREPAAFPGEPASVAVFTYLERWIAWRIYEGFNNRQIGNSLGYGLCSINSRVRRLYTKAGIPQTGWRRAAFMAWWAANWNQVKFIRGRGWLYKRKDCSLSKDC